LGITSVGFDVIYQALNTFSLFIRYWRRKGSKMGRLILDFRGAYDSEWKEVEYNMLIEFGAPMDLVERMKMSLNLT
jgi:hypothetical protein